MTTGATTASQIAKTAKWQIDPAHSAAHFSVRHMMISNVRGEFTKLKGSAVINPDDPAKSSVEVIIESDSLNTREPQRDEHLRSADFFDVANHPTLSFRSKRVEPVGSGHLKVTGDLTIRGTTKDVVFDLEGPTPPIQDPFGNTRIGIEATSKINRKDFGVAFNALTETGGLMVGDEVKITIEAELIEQSATAQAA